MILCHGDERISKRFAILSARIIELVSANIHACAQASVWLITCKIQFLFFFGGQSGNGLDYLSIVPNERSFDCLFKVPNKANNNLWKSQVVQVVSH